MGKQFVIYSACIGSYDNISQPKYIDDRFDYILFTDELKEKHIGVWEVRKVDYSNSDKTRIARYVKTHPHTLLPQYKATVWLDANLEISSSFIYERCIELCESKTQLASIKHPTRDCIYDEAYWIPKSRFSSGAISFETSAIPDIMVYMRRMCCLEQTMSL